MTIAEAIELCDSLKPNSYEVAIKVRWLSELELLIRNEILLTHEDCPEAMETFTGFTNQTPHSTVLFAGAPYDGVYPYYLQMMIDRTNADGERYTVSAAAFAAAFNSLNNHWHNEHTPKTHDITLLGDE